MAMYKCCWIILQSQSCLSAGESLLFWGSGNYAYVKNRFHYEYLQVGWIDLQGQLKESYKDVLYTDVMYIFITVINRKAYPQKHNLESPLA